MMKRTALMTALCALGLMTAASAQAAPGPASAALTACLAKASTADDHILMSQWIFTTIAEHPSVKAMSNITAAQRDDINKKAGALFSRLMIDDCGKEMKAAVEQDGTDAVGASFGTLGEAAISDLMGDEAVKTATEGFAAYFDEDRFDAMFKEP